MLPSRPRAASRASAETKGLAPHNQLRIALSLIVVVGAVGALVVGGGKHVKLNPALDNPTLSASADGKPVRIGGSWIAMIERRISTVNSTSRAPPKKQIVR